jgi:hypothetical protein
LDGVRTKIRKEERKTGRKKGVEMGGKKEEDGRR